MPVCQQLRQEIYFLELKARTTLLCSFFSNNITLAEILRQLQGKINTEQLSFINVRRSAIWVDTCRQLLRKRFSPNNRISIKFTDNKGNSEGAVDVGGPKREFLRLVVKAASEDSGIFTGQPGCRSLYPNAIGMRVHC